VLGARTLRRNEPVQLVLIHGLFSSGAFWLPYLESFGAFQLTIVDVNYAMVLPSDGSLCEVAARVDALIGDKPAHLIAHSFGCWLGMHLQREFLSRSFICPTFATSAFNEAAFRAEIGRLTDADAGTIAQLVERAVA
jgi:predicted alpha/beta hydrolase family esterase